MVHKEWVCTGISRSTGANVISAGCIYRQKLKAQTVTHNRARTQCTWAYIPKKGSLTRCLVMKYHPWHYAGLTWPPSLISRPGASDPCRIAKRYCSGARWAFRSIFIRWQKPATWTRVSVALRLPLAVPQRWVSLAKVYRALQTRDA